MLQTGIICVNPANPPTHQAHPTPAVAQATGNSPNGQAAADELEAVGFSNQARGKNPLTNQTQLICTQVPRYAFSFKIWHPCYPYVLPCVNAYFRRVAVCLCVCVCLSVQAITFEAVNTETLFWCDGTSLPYLGQVQESRSVSQCQGHKLKNTNFAKWTSV